MYSHSYFEVRGHQTQKENKFNNKKQLTARKSVGESERRGTRIDGEKRSLEARAARAARGAEGGMKAKTESMRNTETRKTEEKKRGNKTMTGCKNLGVET